MKSEVLSLIETETKSFRNFTADYIINNYELGKSDLIVRFHQSTVEIVKNQELFQNKHIVNVRMKQIADFLHQAVAKYPEMKDIDLFIPICLSDSTEPQMQSIPALVFCKKAYSNNILIPSINQVQGHWEMDQVNLVDLPAALKEDKMCFVGSLTGRMDDVKNNQRVQIAAKASATPDKYFCKLLRPPLYDATQFEECMDRCKEEYPEISNTVLINSDLRVDIPPQLKYKFQLCVDGHVSAWARLPWQMSANCIPMKIRNPKDSWVEWFYPLLDFSKHCVESSVEDIEEVYDYLVANPQQQMDIIEAGKTFANEYCTKDMALDVFANTLLLLNKKQDNTFLNRGK